MDFSQFHVYSIEWDSKYIRWFVDGQQFNEFYIENGTGNTEEFQRPFFLLLNLAVGGNWPGSPNNSTPFPSQMLVDYVRVYQDSGTSNVISDGIYDRFQGERQSDGCCGRLHGKRSQDSAVDQLRRQ